MSSFSEFSLANTSSMLYTRSSLEDSNSGCLDLTEKAETEKKFDLSLFKEPAFRSALWQTSASVHRLSKLNEIEGVSHQALTASPPTESVLSKSKAQQFVRVFSRLEKNTPKNSVQRVKTAQEVYQWYQQDPASLKVEVLAIFQRVDQQAQKVLIHACESLRTTLCQNLAIKELVSIIDSATNWQDLMRIVSILTKDSEIQLSYQEATQKALYAKMLNARLNLRDFLAKDKDLCEAFMQIFSNLSWKCQLILILQIPQDQFINLQRSTGRPSIDFNQFFNELSPSLVENLLEKYDDKDSLDRLKEIFSKLSFDSQLIFIEFLSDEQFKFLHCDYIQSLKINLTTVSPDLAHKIIRRFKGEKNIKRFWDLVIKAQLQDFVDLLSNERNQSRDLIRSLQNMTTQDEISNFVIQMKSDKKIWWPESLFHKVHKSFEDTLCTMAQRKALLHFCIEYLRANKDHFLEIRLHLDAILHQENSFKELSVEFGVLKDEIHRARQNNFASQMWEKLKKTDESSRQVVRDKIIFGYNAFLLSETLIAYFLDVYKNPSTSVDDRVVILNFFREFIQVHYREFTMSKLPFFEIICPPESSKVLACDEQVRNTEVLIIPQEFKKEKGRLLLSIEKLRTIHDSNHLNSTKYHLSTTSKDFRFQALQEKIMRGERCLDEIAQIAQEMKDQIIDLVLKVEIKDIWGVGKTKENSTTDCIQDFNNLSLAIAFQILSVEKPDERAKMIEFFINLCHKSLRLGNLHGFMAIQSGLNNSCIARLKRTWELVDNSSVLLLKSFSSLQGENYKKLRQRIQHYTHLDYPFVPFFPVLLGDLTFIDEGNPDISGDQINFSKLDLYSRVLHQLWQTQQRLKRLKAKLTNGEKMTKLENSSAKENWKGFVFWLKIQPVVDDEALYQLSLSREALIIHEPKESKKGNKELKK